MGRVDGDAGRWCNNACRTPPPSLSLSVMVDGVKTIYPSLSLCPPLSAPTSSPLSSCFSSSGFKKKKKTKKGSQGEDVSVMNILADMAFALSV